MKAMTSEEFANNSRGTMGLPFQQRIREALEQREALLETMRPFCDYYSGNKAAMLGNGQARKSLDEFNALLARCES